MNGTEVKKVLEELYPNDFAYEWDNVGLQVGTLNKEIKGILITLDLTKDVVKEAIDNDCNLIIVHHPLLFSPIKKINTDSYLGNIIELLIKNDISLYVAHTNFDISNHGMNNILASMLKLDNIESIDEITENEGLGKIGTIKKTPMKTYIETVKKTFDIDHARFIGDLNKDVTRVAITGGSGSSNIMKAKLKKADLYITGDLGYHHALDCKSIGLNALDVGHNIEKHFAPHLKEILDNKSLECKVIISIIDTNPYKFV